MPSVGARRSSSLRAASASSIDDLRWQNVHDQGHEIGNHTATHMCTAGQVESGQNDLAALFGAPTTLAAPNGSSACRSEAEDFVFLNRSVSPAEPILPLGAEDPFSLNCYIPVTNQAASVFNGNIDDALSQNGWIIYVIHGINPGLGVSARQLDGPRRGHQLRKSSQRLDRHARERRGVLARAEDLRRCAEQYGGGLDDLDVDLARAVPARKIPARHRRRRHPHAKWRAGDLGPARLLRDRFG